MPPPARFPCPCCGFLTLPEEPPGTYDICPVCFTRIEASAPEHRLLVRPPRAEEVPAWP